jgi:hypothetical protein
MLRVRDAVARCIRDCMLDLLVERGPGRSVCPSEVARASAVRLGRCWQELMPSVRAIALALVDAGEIEAIQREVVVDPGAVHGPVHLRLRPDGASAALSPPAHRQCETNVKAPRAATARGGVFPIDRRRMKRLDGVSGDEEEQ